LAARKSSIERPIAGGFRNGKDFPKIGNFFPRRTGAYDPAGSVIGPITRRTRANWLQEN
jgi:hypothetical protein